MQQGKKQSPVSLSQSESFSKNEYVEKYGKYDFTVGINYENLKGEHFKKEEGHYIKVISFNIFKRWNLLEI